jgi:translation initiation factor 2B subunit (eIF-2B alpha/beta/delta family)
MNKKRFDKIADSIKKIKIQGARNVARAALYAYSLMPGSQSIKKLKSLRPTEPMLAKVLSLAAKKPYQEILSHFDAVQEKINRHVLRLIKTHEVIFTHCHSTNVANSLIYAKKKGKKFQVYNTETRPLFQGRKTARELRKAGIKVTMFIDSATAIALKREKRADKTFSTKVFFGADALLNNGIINKIGSGMIAELAHNHKIPVYIIADSWKFSKHKIPIENRNQNEIWNRAPKNIRLKNPAFEFVPEKYITGIVTEFGLMNYGTFARKMAKSEINPFFVPESLQ